MSEMNDSHDVQDFPRALDDALLSWSESSDRKPLVLLGPRQSGKTHALRKLAARRYGNTAYVDFSQTPEASAIFDGSIKPSDIVRRMEMYLGIVIRPGDTLLVFDEVQLCERALTSLKYFCDEAPQYHVAVAGSLLGVAVNRARYSFPVGKVDIMPVNPLTFHEFLVALGFGDVIGDLSDAVRGNRPFAFHDGLLSLFRLYMTVGGMPEAVLAYANARGDGPHALGDAPTPAGLAAARRVQDSINTAYEADMVKYVDAVDSARLFEAWRSIPAQLAKENHKFQYRMVRSGGRASQYAPAMDWLRAAGVVRLCTQVSEPLSPLAAFENPASFKVYLADTGLLMARYNATFAHLDADAIPQGAAMSKTAGFRGGVAENAVMQTIAAAGLTPYYWGTASKGELEFIIDTGDGGSRWALPIEVKSGANVTARSLAAFRERYRPPYVVRVSTKNIGFDNGVRSVPFYALEAFLAGLDG